MRKNIINSIDDNGLGSIGTINTPPTSSDREIVIWNGTDANTLQGGGVRITTGGVIESPTGVTFVPASGNPGAPYTAWVSETGKLMYGDSEVGSKGDVVGPASAVDNEVVVYDGTTGKLVKKSGYTLSPTTGITVPATVTPILTRGTTPLLRMVGTNSVYYGPSAGIRPTGANNVGIGSNALLGAVSGAAGTGNVAIGSETLKGLTIGSSNTAVGIEALSAVTFGDRNVGLGYRALNKSVQGSFNVAIGFDTQGSDGSGYKYIVNESNNIVIANVGVVGDNNTIRIGNNNHLRAFMAGIRGVTVTAPQMVTIDAAGQLGSAVIPAGGGDVSVSQSWTTAFSVTATNITLTLAKIGRQVSCYLPAFTASLPTPAYNTGMSTIPLAYQCATPITVYTKIHSGGVEVDSIISVGTTGISFSKLDATTFAAGNIGLTGGFCLTWIAS